MLADGDIQVRRCSRVLGKSGGTAAPCVDHALPRGMLAHGISPKREPGMEADKATMRRQATLA